MGSDNICVGFVSCIKCSTLLAHDSKKNKNKKKNGDFDDEQTHEVCLAMREIMIVVSLSPRCPLLLLFQSIQLFLNKQTTQFTCFFLVALFIKIIINKCTHNYECDKCYRYGLCFTMHKQMPFNVQNSELNECAAICL